MKLVEDAKDCWRWISVQAMTFAGALQGAWLMVPEDLRVEVPKNVVHLLTMVLLVLGIAGRLVKQGEPKDEVL